MSAVLLPALAGLLLGALPASSPDLPDTTDLRPAEEPILMPVQEVRGRRIPLGEATSLDERSLESGRATHLGEALLGVDGVAAVRRGASMTEPVIRGLGHERVTTQVGHLPLFGACPGRMDPPVSYLSSASARSVHVVKGLPSVTLGPAGVGGRVVVRSDFERGEQEEPGWKAWARSWYDGARAGRGGAIGAEGGDRRLDWRAEIEGLDYRDYESPGGVRVPADQQSYGGALSLGVRPRSGQRAFVATNLRREDGIEYPSLPMDLVRTDFLQATTGYRWGPERGSSVKIEVGLVDIDHVMDNAAKPNRSRLRARTDATVRGGSFLLRWRSVDRERGTLELGLDGYRNERDALRTRHLVGPDATFTDALWPDALQQDLGAFAELTRGWWAGGRLRLGGRLDWTHSDARATDAPSLGGATVAENYRRIYGASGEEIRRDELAVSANALTDWSVGDRWDLHGGAGLSMRPAGITERYYAFAPAPGGFLVGNPGLDAEKKLETVAAAQWTGEKLWLRLDLHHSWVVDFLHQATVALEDVDGDGTDDRVRGYSNVDARLWGIDGSARLWLGDLFSLPLGLAYVRGTNESDDQPLPEIPPLEGRAALRFERRGGWREHAELGLRAVARQERIDPGFGEDETPGFVVLHLRAGADLPRKLRLELAVENLLDHRYHEHLTREAALAVGDLAAGDEIPAVGRSWVASLRAEF